MAKRGGFPGGGMPGNMANLMKQAQKMQRQMEEQAKEMETKEFSATAGGGAVEVTVSGSKKILKVKLDEEVVDPDDVDTSSSSSSSSSGSGSAIADYATQFVGNPYVYGGTSLTNGADCSGFTQSVYANFGVSLPRTSYEQQNAGTEVSYADAQPGDLICYGGHVAIYMGNGRIVHASNSVDGIKISDNAAYRTIVSVRRLV